MPSRTLPLLQKSRRLVPHRWIQSNWAFHCVKSNCHQISGAHISLRKTAENAPQDLPFPSTTVVVIPTSRPRTIEKVSTEQPIRLLGLRAGEQQQGYRNTISKEITPRHLADLTRMCTEEGRDSKRLSHVLKQTSKITTKRATGKTVGRLRWARGHQTFSEAQDREPREQQFQGK